MRIWMKLATGTALTLLLLIALSVTVYRNLDSLKETSDWVTRIHTVRKALAELHARLLETEALERRYVLSRDEKWLAPYAAARDSIAAKVDDLAVTVTVDIQRERAASLRPLIDARIKVLDEANRIAKEKGLDEAAKFIGEGQGLALMDKILGILSDMDAEAVHQLEIRQSNATETRRMTDQTVTYGTGLAFLLMGLTALLIARNITRRLSVVRAGAERLAVGALDHRIDISGSDEVGDLASAFNRMAESLRKTLSQEQQARARIEGLLATITESANRLAAAAAEILAGTTQQAAGAQEEAAAVTETVATVEEVQRTSEQAAQRAKAVADASHRALEIGGAGRKAVEDTLTAMDRVRQQSETTAGSILALAEQAQAIGEIISAVNEIADQTNLLALNAAIEAARAGEQGKGFAVVASEVKALADQSKKSTAQVRQILGEIQKATNGAVIATEEGTKSVGEAMRVVRQAGETIKTLAETIAETAQAAAQISASAGQQATGMSQIQQAMRSVEQATQQNLAATRQTERAANDLNALGVRLKEALATGAR